MAQHTPDYLTTKEVADLLRLKERRVYDLAAAGEIPCTRAVGKLLFHRLEIEAWLAEHASGRSGASRTRPQVLLGSHDPLLDWAIRESRSGLATFFDGSFDGLDRFEALEGVAAGLHVLAADGETWNVPFVQDRFRQANVVLVEWAWRERGFIVDAANPRGVEEPKDLVGVRVVPRQEQAGSQSLLLDLLRHSGIDPDGVSFVRAARTENDAAAAVAEGHADVAFGLRSVARQYRLDFVPVMRERFDLLVDRAAWFEPPFQRLLSFVASEAFKEKAETAEGYDVGGLGRVHFNAPAESTGA